MLEEWHLIAVAVCYARDGDSLAVAADARACVVLADSAEDAAAQAQIWAYEALPPQFGWDGHAIKVERLAALLPGVAA